MSDIRAARYPNAVVEPDGQGGFVVMIPTQPDRRCVGSFLKYADAEFYRLAVTGELCRGMAEEVSSTPHEREEPEGERHEVTGGSDAANEQPGTATG